MNKSAFILIHTIFWLILVFSIARIVLVPEFISHRPFGIYLAQPKMVAKPKMHDFSSIFNFVKCTWLQGNNTRKSSVYSVESHQKFTAAWVGTSVDRALPFGYSPTMIWLLAPFVFFSHSTTYCIFVISSLVAVWWLTHPVRCRIGIGLIPYFSQIATNGFILGQTAVLTGFGLLFIRERTKVDGTDEDYKKILLTSVVLWALTAKPPLAVTAYAALIALRQWRLVGYSILLIGASTIIISPLLGNGWWLDYIRLITNYDKVNAPSYFAWSLHPESMATLRGFLSVDGHVADGIASKISSVAWILLLSVIAILGPRTKLTSGGIWALGLLSYLAFCPHVSATEEIQMTLLIPLCFSPGKKPLSLKEVIILATASIACFTSPAGTGIFADNRWFLFILKISLMFFITFSCRKGSTQPDSNSPKGLESVC
jgi:hypothetical protein